jgi:hypothetical protein
MLAKVVAEGGKLLLKVESFLVKVMKVDVM